MNTTTTTTETSETMDVTTDRLVHGNMRCDVMDYNGTTEYNAAHFKVIDREGLDTPRGVDVDVIMPLDGRPSHSVVWIHGAGKVELTSSGDIEVRDEEGNLITTINTKTFHA